MSCFADGIKDISTFFSSFSDKETIKPILDSAIDMMQALSLESLTHVVRKGEQSCR